MKHSESEIIKALNVIRDVCGENACNEKCPLTNHQGACNIRLLKPFAWDIVETKDIFKAFK